MSPTAARLDAALGEVDWAEPPPGTLRSTFAAPSGALAMVSLGDPDAPRILLVPGATGSKEDFALMAPLLADAGYLAVSYDLAGQYESWQAGPLRGRHQTWGLFTRDLIAVLEAGGPAHVLGYSFAGVVAQLAAVQRPELVRSLTLLATPPETGQSFRSVKIVGPLSWLAPGSVGAGLMLWGIRSNKNRVGPSRLAFVRSRLQLTRRSSVADMVALMKHVPDLSGQLRGLRMPILVAAGEHDLWPVGKHARFAARLGAALAVYPAGHSPCETAPHQLVADMLRLFRRAE